MFASWQQGRRPSLIGDSISPGSQMGELAPLSVNTSRRCRSNLLLMCEIRQQQA